MSRQDQFNQTFFSEVAAWEDFQNESQPVEKKQSFLMKFKWPLAIMGAVFFFASTLVIFYFSANQANESLAQLVVTDNQQAEANLSPVERQLILLEQEIAEADPLQSTLAFPPVNFELELQDATLLDQQQRSL